MTAAVLYGATSGALHAVTGPDHVLSLGPVALKNPPASVRVGLSWGLGHALGTLLLAIPLVLLASVVHLPSIAGYGERLAGFALLATAAWSWWSARRAAGASSADERSPIFVGLVHGLTGAGGLVLVLPVLVSGDHARTTLFLFAFALGSTVAMAGLTAALGRLGAKLEARVITSVQRALLAGSVLLGSYWLVAG